jgi:hypothetical protein
VRSASVEVTDPEPLTSQTQASHATNPTAAFKTNSASVAVGVLPELEGWAQSPSAATAGRQRNDDTSTIAQATRSEPNSFGINNAPLGSNRDRPGSRPNAAHDNRMAV